MRATRILGAVASAAVLALTLGTTAHASAASDRKPPPPVMCPNCNFVSYVSVGSRLSGKDFTDAFLPAIYAGNQDLSNSNFKRAAFNKSVLRGANLKNSNFTNADFTDVDMTGAVTTGARFNGVIWNNTTCPDGTNSNSNGGTCVGHGLS